MHIRESTHTWDGTPYHFLSYCPCPIHLESCLALAPTPPHTYDPFEVDFCSNLSGAQLHISTPTPTPLPLPKYEPAHAHGHAVTLLLPSYLSWSPGTRT